MLATKEKIAISLKKHLPEPAIPYVLELMFSEELRFRIKKSRKTKQGDYRFPHNNKPHQISINGDLNPYAFLITTIHEFAHMKNYIKNGHKVKAHGKEWKEEFRKLLLPLLEIGFVPKDIEHALMNSLVNPKASSCTDIQLYRILKKYDKETKSLVLLEELPINAYFRLNKKIFIRGALRRTRYLCIESQTGKSYLVNRLAEVEPINK